MGKLSHFVTLECKPLGHQSKPLEAFLAIWLGVAKSFFSSRKCKPRLRDVGDRAEAHLGQTSDCRTVGLSGPKPKASMPRLRSHRPARLANQEGTDIVHSGDRQVTGCVKMGGIPKQGGFFLFSLSQPFLFRRENTQQKQTTPEGSQILGSHTPVQRKRSRRTFQPGGWGSFTGRCFLVLSFEF